MGNRLSKEQKQCFRLIQQLFKAAGCLPDKRSLDLEYGEKQGRAALIVRKGLDEKRKGPMRASWAHSTVHSSCREQHNPPSELSWGSGVRELAAQLGHQRKQARSV